MLSQIGLALSCSCGHLYLHRPFGVVFTTNLTVPTVYRKYACMQIKGVYNVFQVIGKAGLVLLERPTRILSLANTGRLRKRAGGLSRVAKKYPKDYEMACPTLPPLYEDYKPYLLYAVRWVMFSLLIR